jgi:hypothetical protein
MKTSLHQSSRQAGEKGNTKKDETDKIRQVCTRHKRRLKSALSESAASDPDRETGQKDEKSKEDGTHGKEPTKRSGSRKENTSNQTKQTQATPAC